VDGCHTKPDLPSLFSLYKQPTHTEEGGSELPTCILFLNSHDAIKGANCDAFCEGKRSFLVIQLRCSLFAKAAMVGRASDSPLAPTWGKASDSPSILTQD